MNQNVLTLPASGTCKIIYEHSIHAFPHPRFLKETPYVAFREKGGFIEKLYTVRNRLVLSPPYTPTQAELAHFDLHIQQRIRTYIEDRKKGFGFERPDQAYMFWVLDQEITLPHRPKVKPHTPGHQYFSYEDFISDEPVITKNGTVSKTGVFEYDDFRDNLLIDKYNPILSAMRSMKTKHLRSENSEDAITWNVFKSLQQINPQHWYPELIAKGINQTKYAIKQLVPTNQLPHNLTINLWETIKPPPTLLDNQLPEGPTEVDVIIESENVVWFIEAKFKSDISTKTTHNHSRNQVLRNIDVGSDYAKGKDFYFSLLILEDSISPVGVSAVETYSRELTSNAAQFDSHFLHRSNNLSNVKGITVFYWHDFVEIYKNGMQELDDFEQLIAARAFHWMSEKVDQIAINE